MGHGEKKQQKHIMKELGDFAALKSSFPWLVQAAPGVLSLRMGSDLLRSPSPEGLPMSMSRSMLFSFSMSSCLVQANAVT